jgi:predicted RNA polymerase sigma factor
LQAAIAAVHDEAADVAATDWPQILALYDVLIAIAPGPVVGLNRTVAVAMVRGPTAALAELNDAAADPALSGHHRVDAVRAHLLEELGDRDAARAYYLRAAQRTRSLPERRYLLARAAR